MILAIILFITIVAIDVVSDYRKWLKNRRVNHAREAWIRIAFLLPCVALFSLDLEWWWTFVPAFMVMSWYWLLFDSVYNVLRGFPVFFTGSDDPDDALSDNLLQKLKLWQHIAIKAGGVIISTVGYILLK